MRAVRTSDDRLGEPDPVRRLLDTCGTGGDGASTVNLSTAAAIVAAACGVPVVKHGNRAASGNSGSSDVLTALGVAADPGPEALAQGLAELNIAFLFAPRFHPGLREVAAVRRQLPFRTLFNLVGPLCNPASPGYQLVGTTDEARAGLIAAVLARMPHVRRAAVVTGSDGLDEVTLDGPTRVLVVESGVIRSLSWTPEDFGLPRQGAAGLRVDGPEDSADRIRQDPRRRARPGARLPAGQRRRGAVGRRAVPDARRRRPRRRSDRLRRRRPAVDSLGKPGRVGRT